MIRRFPRQGGPGFEILIAILAVAIATGARISIGLLMEGHIIAYATYYPAVLIAAIIAGSLSGLLTAFLGGAVAAYFFVPPYNAWPTAPAQLVSLVLFLLCAALITYVAHSYRQILFDLQREAKMAELLASELRHRMHNAGAMVRFIVGRSLPDLPDRAERISRRILSLVLHDSIEGQQPQDVRKIVEREVEAFRNSCDLKLFGEEIVIPQNFALVLSLCLHELATNAAKYGAFLDPKGSLKISWREESDRLILKWEENHGLPGKPANRQGFGTTLIKQSLLNCGGKADTQFRENQITAELIVPLKSQSRPSVQAA